MSKKNIKKITIDKPKSKAITEPLVKSNKKKYLLLSLILLLTVLAYSNSINNQFVTYDDDQYIQKNEVIKSLSTKNISEMFSTFYFSNYHPLTTLSYAIDYHFAFNKTTNTINPVRFHVINLLFHLLNILLVFELIYLLVKKVNLAAIAALLFAIHPMHVESVSWISERKDVLYTFFFLLSAVTYLYYLKKERKFKFIIYCFICFCLSLLSKSMAVTLPVLFLLFDYYENHKLTLKNIIEKIPFFVLSFVFGILAIKSQESSVSNLAYTFSLVNQFFLIIYGVVFYIFKFFVPFNLSALHAYPELSGGALPYYYYLSLIVVLVILTFIIFISFKLKKEIIFGLLFFLITISVVLQLIPVGQAIVAERYTYVPYIGLIFIIIVVYNFIKENNIQLFQKIKPYLIGILTVYLLTFSYLTWSRNQVWKNSTSLWSDVINKNPKHYYGYYGLGNAYYLKDQYDEALKNYNTSIVFYPKFADCYYSRGTAKYKQNNYKGAIEDFTIAIQLNPKYQEAYSNRGTAKLQLQDFLSAKQDFDKAIEINPKDATEYYNRGNVEYYMQKDSLALNDLNLAIQLKPIYPDAYVNRGLVYYYMKNINAACNDWNYALQLGHKDAANYLNQFCK